VPRSLTWIRDIVTEQIHALQLAFRGACVQMERSDKFLQNRLLWQAATEKWRQLKADERR